MTGHVESELVGQHIWNLHSNETGKAQTPCVNSFISIINRFSVNYDGDKNGGLHYYY